MRLAVQFRGHPGGENAANNESAPNIVLVWHNRHMTRPLNPVSRNNCMNWILSISMYGGVSEVSAALAGMPTLSLQPRTPAVN
jgi:hypothetical protein